MLPDAGDIAWVELDSALGTEQAGRRPALVLSAVIFHEGSKRAVVCPITSTTRPWPFNVPIPHGMKISGVVLVDQVRAIDRSERLFDVIERAPDALIAEVRGRLAALLGIDVVSSIAETGHS
jgi:mRNA interferase MazF